MSDQTNRDASNSGSDDDAVRIVARNGGGRRAVFLYQALAMFLVACSAGYVLTPRRSAPLPAADAPTRTRPVSPMSKAIDESLQEAKTAADAAAKPSPAPSTITTVSGRALTPRHVASPSAAPPRASQPGAKDPERDGDQSPDLSDFIPPGQTPTAGEVIDELHKRGIYEGIGAFGKPGTSPPLVGLAVPDDFELPEGYVRHFQATDDGQGIDAMLMFHPDYEFFDANGEPIPIPENRVVPCELAPPGFPCRKIVIPPNREPGDLSR